MSDVEQSRAGMCAAFGCPLFGTVGSDGRWFCFCHVNKPTVLNDSITRVLREKQSHIVDATLSIRAHHSSFYGEDAAYRAIQKLLIDAGRRDLLLGEKDCSPERPGKPIVKMWLMRLERELLDSIADIGEQKRIPTTVQTAPVIGPTHATEHMPEYGR